LVCHLRYSSGLGWANHEGVGAGLSSRAFDLSRVLPTFCQLQKLVAEGLPKCSFKKKQSDEKNKSVIAKFNSLQKEREQLPF